MSFADCLPTEVQVWTQNRPEADFCLIPYGTVLTFFNEYGSQADFFFSPQHRTFDSCTQTHPVQSTHTKLYRKDRRLRKPLQPSQYISAHLGSSEFLPPIPRRKSKPQDGGPRDPPWLQANRLGKAELGCQSVMLGLVRASWAPRGPQPAAGARRSRQQGWLVYLHTTSTER